MVLVDLWDARMLDWWQPVEFWLVDTEGTVRVWYGLFLFWTGVLCGA